MRNYFINRYGAIENIDFSDIFKEIVEGSIKNEEKSNPIKECLQYNISVEGVNCELLYFEHLKELINECEKAKYKVNFFIRAKTPSSFAKSRISIYT